MTLNIAILSKSQSNGYKLLHEDNLMPRLNSLLLKQIINLHLININETVGLSQDLIAFTD